MATGKRLHAYAGTKRNEDWAKSAELGGGGFGGVGLFAVFTDDADEGLGGAGKAAVAAVDEAEFAPEINAFDGEELHFAGLDLILGKTLADEGDSGIGGDETLDHADAGQFHCDAHARAVGTEKFIEDLAGKTSPRKNERLLGDFGEGDLGAMGERVSRADHEAQAVFVDVVHLQIRRLDGKGDDADVDGAVFHALQDFVAEVAVDADVDERIAALKFGKNIGKQIEAGRFVGAEDDRALDDVAAVGDDLNGFVAEAEQFFGVFEKNDAGGSQLDGLGRTVEEPGLVSLLELANLCADRGLRAEDFLTGTREALQFGDEDEGSKLIEVHS